VQLAAFNVAVSQMAEQYKLPAHSLEEADTLLGSIQTKEVAFSSDSIQYLIPSGLLIPTSELEATEEEVARWNELLKTLFIVPGVAGEWDRLFSPSHLLRHEETLYREILR
jgi:hypothetical protein